ncbi:MAG TPA: histidinol dehydrogenase [Candidatus Solibacter sp.]|nr:histidinol dehydrogenase [Candidatus Solibacter sp.]
MRIVSGRSAETAVQRLASRGVSLARVEAPVRRIVRDVQRKGDGALRRYAKRWDALAPRQSLRLSESEIAAALSGIHKGLRDALRVAARNIRRFCERQMPKEWTINRAGASTGVLIRPLQSVGCYVPGGRYPLMSTLLMTVIPAQVAGVKRIVVVSPRPSQEVLAAAAMLGVREFYSAGGAHAIAALAYGTKSIARVDKIVGPGNAYVTAAKKLVAFDCAIDFLAGPTEALVWSDSGNPKFIAADLVAQAEHDPDAVAALITTSRSLARAVAAEVADIAESNQIARQSLRRQGVILLASSQTKACDWANRIAPEHITVDQENLRHIKNAGSIFIGDYSAQAAGDYASGPNHVLPTAGQARFRGGLSVMDFVKIVTVQQLSAQAMRRLAPTLECLAEAEGLTAHAESIRVRCGHA